MSGIKDSEKIESLRSRLYERGNAPAPIQNHTLTNPSADVPHVWQRPPQTPTPTTAVISSAADSQIMPKKQRRNYRLQLLGAGVAFFALAIVVSSLILLFGNNAISGKNITLSVTGPFTIGGGEVLPLQIGITNGNAVSIDSALLLIEYPAGTLAATEERNELFMERLPLDSIAAGETINIPLRAVVFGQENAEKTIKVSIEYKIAGSNATFEKDAEIFRYKISSSPVTVNADALKKISSGQSTDVAITISSNSPTTLNNILVKAEYPVGFRYLSADPAPSNGQDTWLLANLEPEGSQTIVITGVISGEATDEYAINFSVGVPQERDNRVFASIFSTIQTEFEIEVPFVAIELDIAGSSEEIVVVESGQSTTVNIEITNTLDEPLYDLVVTVDLGGNALSDLDIGPPEGFYDSRNDQIVWDISNSAELEQLEPGERTRLSFVVEPDANVGQDPQITLAVNVSGRRVSESRVSEILLGTAQGTMRVASVAALRNAVVHNIGGFTDTGSIPPTAEEETTYTVMLLIDNGSNNIADAIMTARLPTYVQWKEKVGGTGTVQYDRIKREITWKAGDINKNQIVSASFQVGIIPSVIQLGQSPVLIEDQALVAQDQFTNTATRTTHPALTTEMSTEAGYVRGNGRVAP